jgi:hypothetical protein
MEVHWDQCTPVLSTVLVNNTKIPLQPRLHSCWRQVLDQPSVQGRSDTIRLCRPFIEWIYWAVCACDV